MEPRPEDTLTALTDALTDALAARLGQPREALASTVDQVVKGTLAPSVMALLARLERAERLCVAGELSAGVAHELRNPLSVIETSVFLLAERVREDPTAARQVRRIADQAGLAGAVVSDLLDAVHERPAPVSALDPAALVQATLDGLPQPLPTPVRFVPPGAPVRALAEPRRVRQILSNLLTNAMRAAGPTGAVTVTIERSNGFVCLHVDDTGPGLPEALEATLFSPLVSNAVGGTGLGLALSRRLARALGATLEGKNREGPGARFTLGLREAP
ncbi:MAG: HAMP domain-containing histidine kinase [Deltaproteobacteria bacterium]|nr:HAMP domain-containing histidine kinase [Deltaproteobacteria bacterium]